MRIQRAIVRCKRKVRRLLFRADTDPSLIDLSANLAMLKQALVHLVELLRTSGVGALPILSPDMPAPTEQMLVTETTRALQVLHETSNKRQDTAGVVANLLGLPDLAK